MKTIQSKAAVRSNSRAVQESALFDRSTARRQAVRYGAPFALACSLFALAQPAQAQTTPNLVSACAGVSLPPSVVTNILAPIVGGIVTPVQSTVNPILGAVGGLLGVPTLNIDAAGLLANAAAGQPINLQVLNANGTVVGPTDRCDLTSDSLGLNAQGGISIGGNRITGLGTNGLQAVAGEANSIAFGNSAVTAATSAGSIAIGTGASVGPNAAGTIAFGSGATATGANSVALGAGSVAARGPQLAYAAVGLATPQNSAGEVSVGSAGAERQITNVAAGTAATDAVNLAQLEGVAAQIPGAAGNAVQYDGIDKTTVTLARRGRHDAHQRQGGRRDGDVDRRGQRLAALRDQPECREQHDGDHQSDHHGRRQHHRDHQPHHDGRGQYDRHRRSDQQRHQQHHRDHEQYDGDHEPDQQRRQRRDRPGAIFERRHPDDAQWRHGDQRPHARRRRRRHRSRCTTSPMARSPPARPTRSTAARSTRCRAADANALTYDTDFDDNRTNTVTLTGGNAAAPVTITNVAAATVTATSTDAVNGSQLYATNQTVVAAQTTANTALALGQNSVQYDSASKTDVTLGGAGGPPVAIHNVAAGTSPTDAVNVAQLNSGSEQRGRAGELLYRPAPRVAQLRSSSARARMPTRARPAPWRRPGLPQAYEAGKGMISMAAGAYGSQTAVALGASKAMNDGHTVVKLFASYDTSHRAGGTAGVGYQF